MNRVYLDGIRFREALKAHESGRDHLGYADVTIVMPGALPDGGDFRLAVPDISVAVTANGTNVIDFRSREVVIDGETKRFAYVYPVNAATRAWLVEQLHALPAVEIAIAKAVALREEMAHRQQIAS